MLRAFLRGLLLSFKSKKAGINSYLLGGLIIIAILIGIIYLIMNDTFGLAKLTKSTLHNTTNSLIAKTP